ncbi:hypothetical protein [Chitinivorax sp. B]|uniref:hypothetical protein n=1 Tax=Chitinivorax sp. B TaxID=2502235 RepID=UPI0010F5338C|nr:hypothetical protein [Chitinivorax sp. B]
MNLFQEVMIWRMVEEGAAVRYCCIRDLNTNKYGVQSADFFRLPLDEKQFRFFEKQFVELFIEIPIQERCGWFDSIQEAIDAHDKEFM